MYQLVRWVLAFVSGSLKGAKGEYAPLDGAWPD